VFVVGFGATIGGMTDVNGTLLLGRASFALRFGLALFVVGSILAGRASGPGAHCMAAALAARRGSSQRQPRGDCRRHRGWLALSVEPARVALLITASQLEGELRHGLHELWESPRRTSSAHDTFYWESCDCC